MVEPASRRPEVPEIEPREAWEHAQSGEAIIVDVREPDEVAEVGVPGAVHIPLGSLPAEAGRLPDDREVLFLCRSGNRSAYATEFLQSRGHPRTANIRGGIILWHQSGLPTTLDRREG